MSKPERYQIDRTRIIFEQFEDETVLVNTETGYYYSLSNSGSEILGLIEDGCAVGELATILFDAVGEGSELRTAVESFVERLAGEGIIVERVSDNSVREPEAARKTPRGHGLDYVLPVLERFDDVRELLLIDPVHQVDQEYGWPKAMKNGDSSEPGK